MKLIKKFACAICKYKTSDLENLNKHCEDSHECDLCGSTFVNKAYHNCIKIPQVGMRHSSLTIPEDENGNPVFVKENSSLRDTICTFSKSFNDEEFVTLDAAIKSVNAYLIKLVESYINVHTSLRMKILAEMIMLNNKTQVVSSKLYPSGVMRVGHINFIQPSISSCVRYLNALVILLANQVSGLQLLYIKKISIVCMKYHPRIGSSFFPVNSELKGRHGLINPRTKSKCFEVSLLISLYWKDIKINGKSFHELKGSLKIKLRRILERQSTWDNYLKNEKIKMRCQGFGDDMRGIEQVETDNNCSIVIYHYSKKLKCVVPLRTSKYISNNNVFLLLLYKSHLHKNQQRRYKGDLHYSVIINPCAFFAVKHRGYLSICQLCGCPYRNKNHVSKCLSNDNAEYLFPSEDNYRFNGYYRKLYPPYYIIFDFLYANDKETSENITFNVLGYTMLGLDCTNKILFDECYIGENAVTKFNDTLFLNCYYLLEKLVQCQLPLRTDPTERKLAKEIKVCESCECEITAKNPITINHSRHDVTIPNNMICSRCNIMWYSKRKILVYSHNLSRHAKYILSNFGEMGLKRVHIIPQRSSDDLLSFTVDRKITFIDTRKHLDHDLHELMRETCMEKFELLRACEKNDDKFNVMKSGFAFPNNIVRNIQDLDSVFPTQHTFIDISFNAGIDDVEICKSCLAYKVLECSSMNDFALSYLKSRVYGLAAVLNDYASFCFSIFGLYPLSDFSCSSYAFAVAHHSSKTSYQNLKCPKIYRLLKDSIIGGLSFVACREVECNSERLTSVKVALDDIREVIYADYRSHYLNLLGESVPYSSYEILSENEVSKFDVSLCSEENDTAYVLCVSMIYPMHVRIHTQSLPLLPVKQVINGKGSIQQSDDECWSNFEDVCTSRVVLNVEDQPECWLSGKHLSLCLNLGLVLKEIKCIIRYRTRPHMKRFVDLCVKGRRVAQSNLHASIMKNIGNRTVGVFLSNGINERVVLCQNEQQAIKYISKSEFLDAKSINDNLVMISLKKKRSLLLNNILIGYHVLQASKHKIYYDYYFRIKPVFGPRIRVLFWETDGGALEIVKEPNLYENLKKLSEVFDFSQLPLCCPLFSQHRQHEVGILKLEAIYVTSYVALRSKQYSLLEVYPDKCVSHARTQCIACSREISRGSKQRMTHQRYKDILHGLDNGMSDYYTVQASGTSISLEKGRRNILTVSDGSRIFYNGIESVPVGLPIPYI